MRITIKPIFFVGLILLYGILFLVPFSGAVHLFDWDEIIFAESAREMLVSGDFTTVTINYEPFWEKPPLFIWLQALSMKTFGINEFAARFPNAVCGILTLLVLYLFGRRVRDHRFGMLWTVSYGTAILPFFYFQTGIIDPWFNLFIFLGIGFFIFYLEEAVPWKRYVSVALSPLFLGLAVLTKGPVAVLLFGISFVIYLVYMRGKLHVRPGHVITFVLVLLFSGGSWFLVAILNGNYDVVREFIVYQAGLFSEDFAGHSGFPGFHFVILLFGVFPASVIMLAGFTKKKEEGLPQTFRTWMYILLFLVLILFSLVQTKLVHYSSLTYFPATFIAAWVLYNWSDRIVEIRKWQVALLTFIALVYTAVLFLVPYVMTHPAQLFERFPGLSDRYVTGVLETDAGWGILDYLPAILLLGGMVFAIPRIARRDVKGLIILHVTVFLFTYISTLLFVPKVEKMIQGPAIAFIKEHTAPGERIEALGFKSFAPYFYGQRMPGDMATEREQWMEETNNGRPVYIVMKADNSSKVMQRYPDLILVGEQGGFVFGLYMTNGNSSP